MTKVNFPTGDVWTEFDLETNLIEPSVLKLKLKPSFKRDIIQQTLKKVDFSKERENENELTSETIVESFRNGKDIAMSLVSGWDLENEKGVIPLTEKSKEKYLDVLMWETVKLDDVKIEDEEEEKKASWLWTKILEFVIDVKNFAKN